MAIVDQARFYETHGLNTVEVGNALADWFRAQEFEWRTFTDPTGRYVVQVRKVGTARSIFGLNYALTISFTQQAEGKMLVELGGADWTDKIVSGAIGALFITPLLFTAGYGAWQQSELTNQVWGFLDSHIYSRTGKSAQWSLAVPSYMGQPGYNPNVPPPPGNYYPSASYAPSAMSGFPPVNTTATQTAPQNPSWLDSRTMQPIFDQQIGRMASWQQAIADGKIVDEEIADQTKRVEELRRKVEENLDVSQRIKLAEVVVAMEKLEAAHLPR